MSSQCSEDSMDIYNVHNGNKDDRQEWQQELSGLVERIVNSEAPRAQQHRDDLISWRNRMLSQLRIGIRDGRPLGVCIRTKQDFEFVRDRLNDLLTALESRDKPVFEEDVGRGSMLIDHFEPFLILRILPSAPYSQSQHHPSSSMNPTRHSHAPPALHRRLRTQANSPHRFFHPASRLPTTVGKIFKRTPSRSYHRRNRVTVTHEPRRANLASRPPPPAYPFKSHSIPSDAAADAFDRLSLNATTPESHAETERREPDFDGAIDALNNFRFSSLPTPASSYAQSLAHVGRISSRQVKMYGFEGYESRRSGEAGGNRRFLSF